MGKKSKTPKEFLNTPFRKLKGVSVSPLLAPPISSDPPAETEHGLVEEDFFTQMSQLGVTPLASQSAQQDKVSEKKTEPEVEGQDDEQLFLDALGQFDASFTDEIPQPQITASPRRMKLLQRGKLAIEARLDLHGLNRDEALERVAYFLDNASFHQLKTLLIVTGKGAHSSDGPVLRDATENFLRSRSNPAVLEWSRAPREHGGEGALVVFLRSS